MKENNGMNGNSWNNGDPFSRFWTDMVSKMAPPGMMPPGSAGTMDETSRQMRQAFFDAWAKYCEEFMCSEPFMDAMRKSMEGALAFKQQVNEFLTKSLHESQMPSREDTDSIMQVLRSVEERVLDRLERLSNRVEQMESRLEADGPAPAAASAGDTRRRPKGGSR